MVEDITPALLEAVTEEFRKSYNASSKIQSLLKKVKDKTATYAEAQEYAIEVSRLIGHAYEKHVSSAVLPDGRMYYNIAARLIPANLDENYRLVLEYAVSVQKALNEKAGIGMKPQTPELNRDRVDGIVDYVSNAEQYDQIADKLPAIFENFSQNVVDETIKKNAEFQWKAGLDPKIIRKAERKCCQWCSNLAGVYHYPDVPDDVYRRHGNCRCQVEYDPGDGRRQNVHTKRLTTPGEHDILEERKRTRLNSLGVFRPKEYEATVHSYVKVDRSAVVKAAKEGKKHGHSGIYADAMEKSKRELQRSIISHIAQVEAHDDKIKHPERYVLDWKNKDPRYQEGLLKKWEKDMRRNAEQAEIELAVFVERYGQ